MNDSSYPPRPEERVERIATLEDVRRIERICKTNDDITDDDWCLVHYHFWPVQGGFAGKAIFVKLIRIREEA